MHEIAHSGVGDQRRVDAHALQVVGDANAASEETIAQLPVTLQATGRDEDVKTLVVLAVGEQLVDNARDSVCEDGLRMEGEWRRNHAISNI